MMKTRRILVVIKFCLVLGSDQNHNRLRRDENGNEYAFPVPKIENVYQAWKPIDYGHPLVDPTLHYIPPELDTVHIGPDPPDYSEEYEEYEEYDEYEEDEEGDELYQDGILNTLLKANVYSGFGPKTKDKDELERLRYKKARQQSRVVKASPSNSIRQQQASPRLDVEQYAAQEQQYRPLRSGMYYVDDPHEEFRPQWMRDRSADRNRRPGDRGNRRRADHQQAEEHSRKGENTGGRYIPVSLLSTPPTITTTERPYGEIVNKDFYEFRTRAPAATEGLRLPAAGRRKLPRKVTSPSVREETVFPLGNPYGPAAAGRNVNPPRPRKVLHGVLGPPRPDLPDQPGRFVDRRSPSTAWEPQNVTYRIVEREIEYPKQSLVYNTDSGQLKQDPVGKYQPSTDNRHPYYPPPPPSPATTEYTYAAPEPNIEYVMKPEQQDTNQKFQLVYSDSGSVDSQVLSEATRCLHGLPSFLRYFCDDNKKQRMDRSTFSERSDAGSAPDAYYRSTDNIPPESFVEIQKSDVNGQLAVPTQYRLVQDNQYDSDRSENSDILDAETSESNISNDIGRIDDQIPFEYVENSVDSGEIVYSVAGGNVALFKPDSQPTTTPSPSPTTSSTTTTATTPTPTTTPKPAVPFQYQPPLPGLLPAAEEQKKPMRRRRPLVYAKRDGPAGSKVSKPFEYISKLTNILSDRVFRTSVRSSSAKDPVRRRTTPRPKLITRRVPGRQFFIF